MKIATLKDLLLNEKCKVQSVKTLNEGYTLIEIVFVKIAIEEEIFKRNTFNWKLSLECTFDMDSFILILGEKYPEYKFSKDSLLERLGVIFYEAIDLIASHNYKELVELFHSKRGKITSNNFGF